MDVAEELGSRADEVNGILLTYLPEEKGFQSISIPAVSSGIFGYPVARCTSVIVDAVSDYLFWYPDTCLTTIHLVTIGTQHVTEFKRALEAVEFADE